MQARFQQILGTDGWKLLPSDEANEEMTLIFHYPNAFKYDKYLQPQIKIEFGRGDQQPSEKSSVTPTVAETFPDIFRVKSAEVPVLDCQRTFWEKITLLHAENHRPEPSTLKKIYFAANWAHYETAVPGTLRIVPNEALQDTLRKDYQQMQEMFPSTPLPFDEILTRLQALQKSIDALRTE